MIKQLAGIQIDGPHISANELAKYVFSTRTEKLNILRDQKYPPVFKMAYYGKAYKAILDSFDGTSYDENALLQAAEAIALLPIKNRQQASQYRCNIEAIRSFCAVHESSVPPVGEHLFIYKNAHIIRQDVRISVRPEIITSNLSEGFYAYTKLHFSKGKYSADAAEIGLLLLLIYGQEQRRPRIQFSIEKTKLIECFSRTVVEGHQIPEYRQEQLDSALIEIKSIWDQVKVRK